jgi:hypothetical protein
MTPERMAKLVARWVRLYTRNLPTSIAQRRIDEIDADLHDHIAHERAADTGDDRIAASIASRMLRGLAADAAWRRRTRNRKETMTQRSIVRVALVTGLILLIPLVAMPFTDGPGWGVFDFVLAAVLLGGTGLLLELAAKKPRSIALRVAAAAIAVAAIAFGEADDAPGLVLFGCLLIIGTVVLTVRTAVSR